jgi:hypothetical protein
VETNSNAFFVNRSSSSQHLKKEGSDNLLLYVGVLISIWLFLFPIYLFAAQPEEFFLDGLKK